LIEDGQLGVTRRGSGPPLVLLHSLGAHRGVWKPVIERLAQEREVIAFDLPGFGDSPPLSTGPATPANLAAAVSAELDRLGIERCAVAGNSLGGWVALELGLAGRVESVTAVAPAGLWGRPLRPKPGIGQLFARGLYPLIGLLLRIGPLRRAILSVQVADPSRVPYEDVHELLRHYARAKGLKAANDAMRAGRFTDLALIPVPVTLAWPEFDRLVARPRQLPANVRSVGLPGAGHLPMWDDPEGLAKLLLEASDTNARTP
jgi:pimeloyl-ACP methyl ester carboxylesterase